jgi:hypothetical protein
MTDKLAQIEAFAQRGMNDSQIMQALYIDNFTEEEQKAVEKGRIAGMALIHDKIFTRALKGNMKAIEYLRKKFEEIEEESQPEPKSYIDRQLEILEKLKP